ncbi:MAG: ROK family protein [Spirochaetales bacterium]|nr:ROK family protein [Spirochaetales bacterium]
MKQFLVGFDLGGTKMLAAVLDARYIVIAREKGKTPAQEGPDAVLNAILSLIESVIAESGVPGNDIAGIGIAVPGTIDRKKGRIINAPNLGFIDIPLGEFLSSRTGLPVMLENDVNAGAFGEWKLGAAKGFSHVVAVFPGTGIGGALILNGSLYRGATGNAGEIGHMIIQTDGPLCGCGQYGCLEAVASRSAMSRDAVLAAASGKTPLTYKEFGTDIKNFKSKTFLFGLKKKEKPIMGIIDRGARFLGIGLANCVNIFNPELILLGGGLVEKLGNDYVKTAEDTMRTHAMPSLAKAVKVRTAELGDNAVCIGAAALFAEEAAK